MTEQKAIDNLISMKVEIEYGTDDTKQMKRIKCETIKVAISALEEIQKYRKLGTVEELRDAREKKISKKMKDRCPDCGTPIKRCYFYCPGCGQAIDWSEDREAFNELCRGDSE